MASRTRILHISCDFPDPLGGAKTPAVKNLIAVSPESDHFVYSLNRVNWLRGVTAVEFAADRVALAYGAPPKGILLATFLRRVARFVLADIRRRGLDCDVIHAHKLTIEGLVGLDLAEALQWPLVASVWGFTDVKVIRARPDLRRQWRAILDRSRALLPAAPWVIDRIDRMVPIDRSKVTNLPIVPSSDRQMRSSVSGNRIASVFRLDGYRNKGAPLLIAATARLRRELPNLSLDIFGGGSIEAVRNLERIIDRHDARAFARLRGPIPNDRVVETLNSYAAFAMPTHAESYGLVHVEALFAGIPILFSRGRGIDGYIAADRIGYACDPFDLEDIVVGLRRILSAEARLKDNINHLRESGELERFRPANIARTYARVMDEVRADRG